MELLVQRLIDGMSNGAIYAALALALVVVFRGTGHLNFAQGEMALFSTYIALALTYQNMPVFLAVLIGAAVGFVIGAVLEVTLISPVGNRNQLAVVIVALGLFLAFNALVGTIWKFDPRNLPSPFPNQIEDFIELWSGGPRLRLTALGTMATVLGIVALLFLLFAKTKIGLAMRAVATNKESARLVGIRVARVLMLSWGLAAFVGAIAGVLIGSSSPGSLVPSTMFGVLIYASAAATLGGFDSPVGAVVGGVALGLIESLTSGYVSFIGSELKLATALAVIMFVLLVRPAGLFGTPSAERV